MSTTEYSHPTIKPAYSRTTIDGLIETAFDTGNGHLVKVIQAPEEEYFTCYIYIVPQFAGASIYNSVKSDEPSLGTISRDEVTEFIDQVIEKHMMTIKDITKL